jgi:hypothetical protein
VVKHCFNGNTFMAIELFLSLAGVGANRASSGTRAFDGSTDLSVRLAQNRSPTFEGSDATRQNSASDLSQVTLTPAEIEQGKALALEVRRLAAKGDISGLKTLIRGNKDARVGEAARRANEDLSAQGAISASNNAQETAKLVATLGLVSAVLQTLARAKGSGPALTQALGQYLNTVNAPSGKPPQNVDNYFESATPTRRHHGNGNRTEEPVNSQLGGQTPEVQQAPVERNDPSSNPAGSDLAGVNT